MLQAAKRPAAADDILDKDARVALSFEAGKLRLGRRSGMLV
ncbi:Uncharacterised protein [Klebsiella aerogenes]|nr:Uncharacterised protein [Klebsiella aerogenes]